MNIKNKTLKELKELCKKNNFKNYSKLNKINLIKLIKKNMKGGYFNGILNRESLLMLLGIKEEELITITEIDLSRKIIKQIIPGTFNGLNELKHLNLSENKITKIEVGAFNGLNELKDLGLYSNQITKIEVSAFNGLSNLTELNLHWNEITKIELGTFDGLSSLKDLYLDYNQITKIELGTFDGLSSLKDLYLDHNQITKIELGTFDGLSNLTKLYLNNNEITKIEVGAFNGLNELKYLNLNNNQFLEIELGTFDGLSNLTFLQPTNYQITEIKLNNLSELKLISVELEEENIRLYNKYYYLYQKINNIDKNVNIVQNKIQISDAFYKKLQLIYNVLRNKTYIDDFNNKLRKNNEEYNKIIWRNTIEERVVNQNKINKYIKKIKLRNDTEINNNIPIKKYLIQKSKFIINEMLNNNNNIKIPSTIINKNSNIELMNKYLKDKNLNNFNNTELLILFKIFDYLYIDDKEIMSSLFEKIFENIKDFDEGELIKLFGFKRINKINNSKNLIQNN